MDGEWIWGTLSDEIVGAGVCRCYLATLVQMGSSNATDRESREEENWEMHNSDGPRIF